MASETLHAFLGRLPSARTSGSQWLARCPAHDDRKASLAVREGDDGRVLVHCHAGCSVEAILAALGLDETALFPEPNPPKATIVETYPYRDDTNRMVYETVRLSPKDFRQRRPDGAGGWIWNLTGVRRLCYRWPELRGHPAILVVEGEKDVNAAFALGVPATTNVGGAGKWTADNSAQLVEVGVRRAGVIPDNDTTGRTHAVQVAASLTAAGIEVRLVTLPDLPPKGDLSDYLTAHTKAQLLDVVRATPRWTATAPSTPDPDPTFMTTFRRSEEGRYVWSMVPPGILFELDRVRRDHHELTGELIVRCDLSGITRTQGGALLTGEFNLSSVRARQERAKVLAQRAKTGDQVDWMAALEEFCERVFEAERTGDPAVRLDEVVPRHVDHSAIRIEGIALLSHHPVILFGDGGSAKSYLSLYLAGRLSQQGLRVLYADWELLSDEHYDRLTRLFGFDKPALWYVSCDKPLVSEQDRLLKIIRANQIQYLIVDSVAVACDGPPEAAEVTTAYFRAIRALGVGSLHLAHTNRSDQADRKPFGSAFWHNLARATWFCRRTEETQGNQLTIGLFNRKANLGPLLPPTGFTFQFEGEETRIRAHGVQDIPELASELPLWQRMRILLANGPMTLEKLATELGAKENTVSQTLKRKRHLFDRSIGADGVAQIRLVHSRP